MSEGAYRKIAEGLQEALVEVWRDNYDGAMADLDAALEMLERLADGRTTPERAREWLRLNYPQRGKRDG